LKSKHLNCTEKLNNQTFRNVHSKFDNYVFITTTSAGGLLCCRYGYHPLSSQCFCTGIVY